MKTDAVGAGIGATGVLLNNLSVYLFGAPISLIVAAFGGAIFGATYFPPNAKVSRPWAVLVNTLAGVILATVVSKLLGWEGPVMSGIGFVIAAAPVLIFRWVLGRVTGGKSESA